MKINSDLMISVIVLVENSKHLNSCISSILMQTYSNIEVICIINNSNESALPILKNFEENDQRIKIIVDNISKKSHISKNIALKYLKGDYVLFLDSNLKLNDDAIEIFLKNSKEDNLDFIIFDNGCSDEKISINDYSSYKQFYNKVLINDILDEKFLFKVICHEYYLFFNKTFLLENNVKFFDEIYFKSKELFLLNLIFQSKRLLVINQNLIKTYSANFNKNDTILNINLFYDFIDNVLSNTDVYNKYKLEFWKFVFNNIYNLINKLPDDVTKRNYFKDSKVLFDYCCIEKKYRDDIYNTLSFLEKEFFNQSLNEVYYLPKKMNISQKIFNKDFNQLTIAIKSPNPVGDHVWGDYYFAVSLKKSLEKRGFKVVVHEFDNWYCENDNEDIVIVLRGRKEYVPNKEHINIIWNISHPELLSLEEYELYDIVFIASRKYANILEKKLNTVVKPLLQCTDPDIFYPYYNKDFDEDILFVGSTRSVFRDIIKDISNTSHDFVVYGNGWGEFIDKKYIKGDFIPNNILNQYYSSCKILLNDHWEEMREFDFPSNRLFDALACGAFVISDQIDSATNLFNDNVVTYENNEDLDRKLTFYLNNDYERYSKSKMGRRIVLSKHTFDNRVEEIIETIKNVSFK